MKMLHVVSVVHVVQRETSNVRHMSKKLNGSLWITINRMLDYKPSGLETTDRLIIQYIQYIVILLIVIHNDSCNVLRTLRASFDIRRFADSNPVLTTIFMSKI